MKQQQAVGAWMMGLGQLLLVAMVVLFAVDIFGLTARGGLMIPLTGYLAGIFTAVFMQFLGSAIPRMRFSNIKYDEQPI
ncbi:MAG: hypothetical protein AAF745_17640 [Planctomycetota bacterium]